MTQRPPDRALTALIAALALWAVGMRVQIEMGEEGLGLAAAVWELLYFFTILTNLLIGAAYGAAALRGRPLAAPVHLGLVTAIVIVGTVYHVLLSDLVTFTGIGRAVDAVLHSIVPALCVLHWLAFAPKAGLSLRHPLLWLAYPGVYVVYVMIRAPFTGWYPYPFLDISEQGLGPTLAWIAGIAAFFLVLGSGLALAGQRLAARQDR